ncbi:MAG TPA: two-component regulator propeller domain-containing protein, partial [Verrucomicrobiae bacterium]|nr:two-component regulator propeller domain-containing protein [Verrucomicrobiae bacterium]
MRPELSTAVTARGQRKALAVCRALGVLCVRTRWIRLLAAAIFAALRLSSPATAQTGPEPRTEPADELVFRSWRTEGGLPHNTVNAIAQTRDGYLWIATRDGLARFDGVRFRVFGLPEGLPSVEVQTLYEDSKGT